MGLVAPWHVGSSRTRDGTRVPCIGRCILNHCATREVPSVFKTEVIPSFPLNFMILILLKVISSHFVKCPSNWICSMLSIFPPVISPILYSFYCIPLVSTWCLLFSVLLFPLLSINILRWDILRVCKILISTQLYPLIFASFSVFCHINFTMMIAYLCLTPLFCLHL